MTGMITNLMDTAISPAGELTGLIELTEMTELVRGNEQGLLERLTPLVRRQSVALDLTITPALRRAGLARDVVRTVQEARKNAGLEVSDRIELGWRADGELAQALREHGSAVAEEVLAVVFAEAPDRPVDAAAAATAHIADRDAETGLEFWFCRVGG